MAQKKKRTEIREEMSLIVSNLDQRWLDAASAEVNQRIVDLIDNRVGREIKHFLAFLPFFRGEADMTQLIVEQLEQRRVYLPRITGERAMDFVEINKDWIRQLEQGFFGIPGPRVDSGAVFNLAEAAESLVLVPGLAFDRWGNWLGRVSGYYNKFFARKEMHSATKVGVCWELQMVPDLPVDPYQVNLDWVCHERELIRTAPQFDEDLADE